MAVKRRSIRSTTPQAKENYYYYSFISDNDSFYHSNNNNNNNNNHHHHHYHSESSPLQNQGSNTTNIETRNESSYKRILIVDDDIDITFTYKLGLERHYEDCGDDHNSNKIRFEVFTYNNPLTALSEFRSNFYDLLLIDINMPDINGFQLCQKILELDANVRVCFISAGEVNIEALREVYPNVTMGCFIRKPVSIDYLVKRLSAELD